MDISYLRQFVELAEKLNFTKAAEKAGVRQPNLSKAMKSLESEYGFQLFVRTSRKVELTAEGEILHRHVREALRLYDEGVALAKEESKKRVKTIRMDNVFSKQSVYSLIKNVAALAKSRDLPFRIVTTESETARWSPRCEDPLDAVVSGSLDASIVYLCDEVRSSELVIEPLFREQLLFCVKQDPAVPPGKTADLEDFKKHRFISPGFHRTWDAAFLEMCRALDFEPTIEIRRAESVQLMLADVGAEEALPLIASDAFFVELPEMFGCSLIPVEDQYYEACLVYRKASRSAEMEQFVELTREVAKDMGFSPSSSGRLADPS